MTTMTTHAVNAPTSEQARQMANAIRMLAVDAVEKAKSGHPGAPMGMASFGESAPAADLYAHFGITAQRVVEAVRALAHRAAHRRETWLGSDEREHGPLSEQIVLSAN